MRGRGFYHLGPERRNKLIYKHFEKCEVGEKIVSRARTVTETDVVMFCYLTGNWLQLHSDRDYARKTAFGERLVQGALVFSLIPGMFDISAPGIIVASYGIDKIRYVRPVKIGDTIHAEASIVSKEDKGKKGGVITQNIEVKNGDGEVVQICVWKMLISKGTA